MSISDMQGFCLDDYGVGSYSDPVKCAPLKSYLDEAHSRHHTKDGKMKHIGKTIDFMSIDVEQYFMPVLESVPFDEYNIRVLVVECNTSECYDLLESKGYNVLPAGDYAGKSFKTDTLAWKNDC